jgi:hypothetical protein
MGSREEDHPLKRAAAFLLLALSALLAAWAAEAQTAPSDPAGPVPPSIRAAKKIFISNAGSDSGLFPEPFTGDSNRPYTEFYNGLKASGQYQLMSDPAQADLVLELRLLAPPNATARPDSGDPTTGPLPMLRLVVYDRATHYILWTITEPVEGAILVKTFNRNLDNAIQATLKDFERVSGTEPPPAAAAP